jgi:hypothetical protein
MGGANISVNTHKLNPGVGISLLPPLVSDFMLSHVEQHLAVTGATVLGSKTDARGVFFHPVEDCLAFVEGAIAAAWYVPSQSSKSWSAKIAHTADDIFLPSGSIG